jgi:hypothetical protein
VLQRREGKKDSQPAAVVSSQLEQWSGARLFRGIFAGGYLQQRRFNLFGRIIRMNVIKQQHQTH